VLSVNYRLGIGYGHDFQNPDNAGPAGAAEYQDVLAGTRFLRGDPNVDSNRIGIWGGSYGGYLTALALAKNSDVFKVGVDWHGVHDWTEYPEWFGLGSAPVKRYETIDEKKFLKTAWLSSPDAYVSTWRSPVLLIHGDDDRNVRFHQTVDLAIRLKQKGVPFEEMVMPNEIHGFLRWESWLEADEATAEFLTKNLRP
jgi:dipeptidyl aminopeptidase/acylaminoacyl peptidase